MRADFAVPQKPTAQPWALRSFKTVSEPSSNAIPGAKADGSGIGFGCCVSGLLAIEPVHASKNAVFRNKQIAVCIQGHAMR